MEFKKILTCKRCDLHKIRRKNGVVIGRGTIPADILFIGEAPGKNEELRGVAFVGKAGQLLDKMLLDAGFDVDYAQVNSYYITNTIMCRPTNEKYGDNRQPFQKEVVNCAKNVMTVCKAVNPKIVIFIGKVAESYYKDEFPSGFTITHPAWHLRNGGQSSPRYLTDIQTLKEALQCVK